MEYVFAFYTVGYLCTFVALTITAAVKENRRNKLTKKEFADLVIGLVFWPWAMYRGFKAMEEEWE